MAARVLWEDLVRVQVPALRRGCRIVAIISPFQGDEGGSSPLTRSIAYPTNFLPTTQPTIYYFYVLLLKNNNLYKGITSNLKRRIQEHKSGKVTSTKNKRPLKLIHYEGYLLKQDAERREKFSKITKGRRLLKQQIRNVINKYRGFAQ